MNEERIAGIRRQLAGMLSQVWGELSGDPLRVTAARREQIVGKTQQDNGIVQEASARQLRDFQQQNRNWYF